MLDWLSGIFFLVGLAYCIKRRDEFLPYLLIPLLLLPIPSILPGHPPIEIPNSARTMAIIPFVFLLVAYGIDCSRRLVEGRFGARWALSLFAVSLLVIGYLNLDKYFVPYAAGLPNKNVSFGREIANYIDAQDAAIPIYVASLGWGDWQQPSRDSIFYSLNNRKRDIVDGMPACGYQSESFVVILDPAAKDQIDSLTSCYPAAKVSLHTVDDQKVFVSLENQSSN